MTMSFHSHVRCTISVLSVFIPVTSRLSTIHCQMTFSDLFFSVQTSKEFNRYDEGSSMVPGTCGPKSGRIKFKAI